MKTQTTVRVDPDTYAQAKKLLRLMGLSYSQAINIFNSMVVLNNGLPFEIKMPNTDTIKAMDEAKKLEGDFIKIDKL